MPGDGQNQDDSGDSTHDAPLQDENKKPTNEYVLNVAFYSFVGFLVFEAFFALIANSESMLADAEAMSVDALTYLFNLWAERVKKRPFSEKELAMPSQRRNYQRELLRLYLELFPPAISVATLIAVTVMTLREALNSLFWQDREEEEVSLPIMLFFSGANLLLDVVNVTCFARADSTFGLDVVRREGTVIYDGISEIRSAERGEYYGSVDDETTELISAKAAASHNGSSDAQNPYDKMDNHHMGHLARHDLVNLNMCSAWTHICADTLRSTAVLIAAFIAFVVPTIHSATADSAAAIAVSIIILGSLIPLLQGLIITFLQILHLHQHPPFVAS